MRTFAQKPRGSQSATPALNLLLRGHHDALLAPRPVSSNDVAELSLKASEGKGTKKTPLETARFDHDFTTVPLHAPGAGVSAEAMAVEEEKNGLRISNIEYNADGQPLNLNKDKEGEPVNKHISEADKSLLTDALKKLQEGDPAFYDVIKNEDVVIAKGFLPGITIGQHVGFPVERKVKMRSAYQWFLIDNSGTDPLGQPDGSSTAWQNAIILAEEKFPTEAERNKLATTFVTRVISVHLASVIIIDLDKIDKLTKKYKAEGLNWPIEMPRPNLDVSPLLTLRHEAGHLVFRVALEFDKEGNPLPEKKLPDKLTDEVEKHSGEHISTDVGLLSEYAARGVVHSTAPFDLTKFKEENDPTFGIGGYHDVVGKEQAPKGFGMRIGGEKMSLIDAKLTVAKLKKALGDAPIFFLTVPVSDESAQRLKRRFNIIILEEVDKVNLNNKFLSLTANHPELKSCKHEVVAF